MKNTKIKNPLLKLMAVLLIIFLVAGSARRTEAAQTAFPDVAKNAWYRDAVTWAIDEKVTSGRGGYFLPDKTCTRAEAVTFLYNFAGRPSVKANTSFADVRSSSLWYYNAVAWAVNNHITSGYGTVDGKPIFSPDTVCSRAMIVTMLRNYAENVDNCYKPSQGAGRSFPDVRSGQWYYESVSWASATGVASGKGDGRFHPDDSCTRAQIVTFIYNYRMRVAPGHVHSWVTETVIDKKAYDERVLVKEAEDVQKLVSEAWDEPVYDYAYACNSCDFWTFDGDVITDHCIEEKTGYHDKKVQIGTIHHDAVYETIHHDAEYKTVHHDAVTHTVTRCSTCGAVK